MVHTVPHSSLDVEKAKYVQMVESDIMEANTEAEIMEEVDTLENDIKYANKDEEPPEPGICPTFAVLAGGGNLSLAMNP